MRRHGTGLGALTAQLRREGARPLQPLPSLEEMRDAEPARRDETLRDLRVELYALAALVADATVQRARRERAAFPPFGLARSRFTEWRMLLVRPDPYEEASIDGFFGLWRAYVDTLVYHLHNQMSEQRRSDDEWILTRIGALLARFRPFVDDDARARMKDVITFVYGGLQFGASVSVQLAEVMARLLEAYPELTPPERAAVIERSLRPAYRLAAMRQRDALAAYRSLLSAEERDREGGETPGWMDPRRFAVQESVGEPRKIDVREHAGDEPGDEEPARDEGGEATSATAVLGCPARISPSGGPTPIALLWSWCAELARDTGLLGPVKRRRRPPASGTPRA